MNLPNDEIARQLRAADAAQRRALPRFGAALRQAFDPDSATSADTRGALVGLPTSRRGFLRVGGMTVAASAVLVACGGGGDPAGVSQTGSVPPPEPNPLEVETGAELNMTLLLTASSVEALAVATYDQLLAQGVLRTGTLEDTARLFAEQHGEHLELLSQTVRGLGGTPYEEPNPFLDTNLVQPAIAGLADLEGDEITAGALDIAYSLENAAAQTYTQSAGLFDDAALRSAATSIGAVEARHVSVILGAQEQQPVPFSQMPIGAAVPADSYITEDGPVTEIEDDSTSDTSAPEGDS